MRNKLWYSCVYMKTFFFWECFRELMQDFRGCIDYFQTMSSEGRNLFLDLLYVCLVFFSFLWVIWHWRSILWNGSVVEDINQLNEQNGRWWFRVSFQHQGIPQRSTSSTCHLFEKVIKIITVPLKDPPAFPQNDKTYFGSLEYYLNSLSKWIQGREL